MNIKKIIIVFLIVCILCIVGYAGYFEYIKINKHPNVQDIQKNDENGGIVKTLQDIKEIKISAEIQEKMISQAINISKNNKIIDNDFDIYEEGIKLFQGSFINPYSKEYLLTFRIFGGGTWDITCFAVFDDNENLIGIDYLGGYTHSAEYFNLYKCDKNGKYLFLMQLDNCSNGILHCETNFIELKNFTNDGFETTQNIFKYNSSLQDETYSIEIQNEKIYFYQWKIYFYNNIEEYENSEIKNSEEYCKKINCLEYEKNPCKDFPCIKDFLVLKKIINFNKENCLFE